MATIALYANKINQMPALIKDVKKATGVLRTQLGIVQKKCQAVDPAVCNLDDVISTISASTKTQDEKSAMLETFSETVEQFAQDTEAVDDKAANRINKNKDDFYDKYSYLKPDCEKSGWEKFCAGCQKVGQWCKEHWKQIATVLLVIAAVAIFIAAAAGALVGAVAVLLLAAAKGILIGVAVGGLAGGIVSTLLGESFWDGFWDGAFGGAISGMLSGMLSTWISMGMKVAAASGSRVSLTCLQTMIVNGISEGLSSVLGDAGDIICDVKEISIGELVYNAIFSAGLAATISKFVYDLPSISIEGITSGRGNWASIWEAQTTRTINHESIISLKTIIKGICSDFTKDSFNHLAEVVKNIISEAKNNALKYQVKLAGGDAG